MLRTLWVRLAAIAALAAAICVVPAATSSAGTKPPSVGLLSVIKHADVQRYEGSPDIYVEGVNVAAVHGAFEVAAVAAKNGTVTLWQVRRDAHGVHRIRQLTAPAKVDMGTGLPDFFHFTLTDPAGKKVADTKLPFCPNGDGYGYGGGGSRTDANGPVQPTYPYMCGSDLSRTGIWGIDKSWATTLNLYVPGDGVPDGEYTMNLSITPSWVHQLKIPAKSAAVSLALTVTTQPDCTPEQPCGPSPAARTAGATVKATEGPRNVGTAESFGDDGVRTSPNGTPDLAALPAHSMSTENNADDHHDYLDFGATIWNAGSGPLVVEGFRQGANPVMTGKQFIYRNGQPVRSANVGEFEFDTRPGHNHWHMEDIAQYDLLDASGQRVVLSEKQSFCLAPTDPIDLTLKGADWHPDRTALWSACAGEASIWLREVLPAGWGDTYYQDVAGQSFDLTGLPNGRYQVRVTTDPAHKLLETNYDNNAALQPVEIGGTPGNRTVTLVK